MDWQKTDNAQPPSRTAPDPAPVKSRTEGSGRTPGLLRDPIPPIILAIALGLDQLTKWLVTSNLEWGESLPAEGFIRITFVQNTGSAFGLFQGYGVVLSIIAFFAVAVMLFLYRSAPALSVFMRIALGLQMGGAIGNLIDRLRLGYVVDFIDIGPWPVFNIADSSIVVGIAVLAWYIGTGRDRLTDEREEEQDSGDESPGNNTV